MPEESSPDQDRYFFAYSVEITNAGPERVQLRSRYWRIVDGRGETQEVRGAGVVGQQPMLEPGETFCYTCGCPLPTPDGTMAGRLHHGDRRPARPSRPRSPPSPSTARTSSAPSIEAPHEHRTGRASSRSRCWRSSSAFDTESANRTCP